jgi:hypothetical protein
MELRTCLLSTMVSKALALMIVCSLFLTSAGAKSKTSNDPVFDQLDHIVKTLSDITGLEQKNSVPYGRMNKRQLHQFLSKRMKSSMKPDEVRADELSLKMFGLVPQDFDLKRSTLDLLTEQAAAFYDYQEKKLFLLDTSSFMEEEVTLAHELSHALVDQHFDMSKFMEEGPTNDDENLAHSAVVEGQATWLMVAYQLKQSGQEPTPTPEMLKQMTDGSDTSTSQYPVLSASPLYIQRSLLFPYVEGTVYFDAVYHKLGKDSFAAVFKDPPVDSSQIIHPDRYFDHIVASKPAIPAWKLSGSSKQVAEGDMGEFDYTVLITMFSGKEKAADLAPHLRGSQYRILEIGREKRPVLEYIAEWDTPEHAKEYFVLYKSVLKGKSKACQFLTETETELGGSGDYGYFTTRLDGTYVTSLEGISAEEEWTRISKDPPPNAPPAKAVPAKPAPSKDDAIANLQPGLKVAPPSNR